ncbi:MAG: hypothetical protein CLLPBCKN_007628 [Chroococcidiopsis cubana SAG 39.79]|nr:hypothetical protein [Chroococcidiopsis cubana SAG 39.79]
MLTQTLPVATGQSQPKIVYLRGLRHDVSYGYIVPFLHGI